MTAKNDDVVVRGLSGSSQLFIQASNGANVTFGFDPPIRAAELKEFILHNLVPKCPSRGRVLGLLRLHDCSRYSLEEVCADPAQFRGYVLQLILEHEELRLVDFCAKVEELRIRLTAERPLSLGTLQEIVSSCRIRWTWASNAIEGSTYTLAETSDALLSEIAAPSKLGEFFVNAIDHAAAITALFPFVQSRGLSCDDIRSLHGILMKRSFEPDITPGAYRTVAIRVTGTRFQFPEALEVPSLMDEFARWLNAPIEPNNNAGAIIERAALAHLRFVTIHPFSDGNGRMARLLLNLVLMQNGLLPIIIEPTIRPVYMAAIQDYQRHKDPGHQPPGDQPHATKGEAFIRLVAELVYERLRNHLEGGPEVLPEGAAAGRG
ncbi:putative cell filamentation protein Fic [Paratrimastix pyriformis]|uniref:Cell filamentation protein Fic n=1 Tax=Paratrimastix pyriformis TaxID=342808 RepID=A0ABQ8U9I4_9EUKA|nr:putative cell filamentation protein Fic [Paratrimastix pyriformis]